MGCQSLTGPVRGAGAHCSRLSGVRGVRTGGKKGGAPGLWGRVEANPQRVWRESDAEGREASEGRFGVWGPWAASVACAVEGVVQTRAAANKRNLAERGPAVLRHRLLRPTVELRTVELCRLRDGDSGAALCR